MVSVDVKHHVYLLTFYFFLNYEGQSHKIVSTGVEEKGEPKWNRTEVFVLSSRACLTHSRTHN